MNYWKVILATIVIFGAGVFTGGLLVDNADHSHLRNVRHPQTSGDARAQTNRMETARSQDSNRGDNIRQDLSRLRPPEMFSKQFVQQMDDALHLTPEQRDKITKIIADGQDRNREIWTNNSAQMRAVIQDVRHRVRESLNADQQKQFEELMKRAPRRQGSTNSPPVLPTSLTGSNLSPEAQVIMIEAERLKAQQGTNPTSNILPPALLAPSPAPAN